MLLDRWINSVMWVKIIYEVPLKSNPRHIHFMKNVICYGVNYAESNSRYII